MTYLRPILSSDPARPATAMVLAGGPLWFEQVEILSRGAPSRIVAASDVPEADLAPFIARRADIAGLDLSQPRLMGILNVTPDSFSDGGQHVEVADAVARARAMVAEGADLIDIGGESTRPGAKTVPDDEESARVAPVIEALRLAAPDLPISLDTRKSAVAGTGLRAGASIINDVSGLRHDPALASVTAQAGAGLMVMHSIGTPETMQDQAPEAYGDVVLDVYDTLRDAVAQAEAAGVPRDRIVVDPGIGFGKTQAQNLALVRRVALFHGLGCAVLLGVSRKGFIGAIGQEPNATARGAGSAAIGLWALGQGVQILRIHDIALHAQAIRLWRAASDASWA